MAKKSNKLTNFKANLKNGFSGAELKDDAISLFAVPLYTLLPTALKMSGWAGMAVGFGATYLTGKLLGLPAMCRAAIGITGTHLMYHHGNGVAKSINPEGIWSYGMKDDMNMDSNLSLYAPLYGLAETPDLYSLQSGAEYANIGGENVVYYPSTMNDYMPASQLNDYISLNSEDTLKAKLNDYVRAGAFDAPISVSKF